MQHNIPFIKLIIRDTTLDLSQKTEKQYNISFKSN